MSRIQHQLVTLVNSSQGKRHTYVWQLRFQAMMLVMYAVKDGKVVEMYYMSIMIIIMRLFMFHLQI